MSRVSEVSDFFRWTERLYTYISAFLLGSSTFLAVVFGLDAASGAAIFERCRKLGMENFLLLIVGLGATQYFVSTFALIVGLCNWRCAYIVFRLLRDDGMAPVKREEGGSGEKTEGENDDDKISVAEILFTDVGKEESVRTVPAEEVDESERGET